MCFQFAEFSSSFVVVCFTHISKFNLTKFFLENSRKVLFSVKSILYFKLYFLRIFRALKSKLQISGLIFLGIFFYFFTHTFKKRIKPLLPVIYFQTIISILINTWRWDFGVRFQMKFQWKALRMLAELGNQKSGNTFC